MQLHQLAYFVAVADERHFTRAAKTMHVAQPSLSKQIAALEAELGGALFSRARGNISLTVAGEALLPLAQRILADVDASRTAVRELLGLQQGRVRLGATPSLSTVTGTRRAPALPRSLPRRPPRSRRRWLAGPDRQTGPGSARPRAHHPPAPHQRPCPQHDPAAQRAPRRRRATRPPPRQQGGDDDHRPPRRPARDVPRRLRPAGRNPRRLPEGGVRPHLCRRGRRDGRCPQDGPSRSRRCHRPHHGRRRHTQASTSCRSAAPASPGPSPSHNGGTSNSHRLPNSSRAP